MKNTVKYKYMGGNMKQYLLIFLVISLFTSCHSINMKRIKNEIYENQKVETVTNIRPYTYVDDEQYIVELKLKNGGRLVVVVEYYASRIIDFLEIGKFSPTVLYIQKNYAGEWGRSHESTLYIKALATILHKDDLKLNDIINNYDEIINVFQTIYDESPIPGNSNDDINSWGDETELKKYTGYTSNSYLKTKLYIHYINELEMSPSLKLLLYRH
ncbi:hypothetical protein FACS189485_18730 [Spirochaetia bacterium]|nr:hypothetical protein FACS189485_18730 [Spirochaetia bacterium]